MILDKIQIKENLMNSKNVLYLCVIAFLVVATGVFLASCSGNGNDAAGVPSSEAAITELTVGFDGKSYPITFDGNNTFVLNIVLAPNEVAPTQFNVNSVTLSDKATGLTVGVPLLVDNNAVAITITAEDGTQASYTISVSHLTIPSATQIQITDGTKSDDTKKLPSNFMVFDITNNMTTQINVEFLLVKAGNTAPTDLTSFRKTASIEFRNPSGGAGTVNKDVVMAHKSILTNTGTTSLYLAHDSEGNYPLDTKTTYALYALFPDSADQTIAKLGDYTTGEYVDPKDYTDTALFIEQLSTADNSGNFYIKREQFMVFTGLVGQIPSATTALSGPPSGYGLITNNSYTTIPSAFNGNTKQSTTKPGVTSISFLPEPTYSSWSDGQDQSFRLHVGFSEMYFNFKLVD